MSKKLFKNEGKRWIIAYINSIERPENYNEDEVKEHKNMLYEKLVLKIILMKEGTKR